MVEKKIVDLMTPEEYLAFEENSQFRHEYVDGRIFAMTGGTLAHNKLATNLFRPIDRHLEGSGCNAYIADVKVHVQSANCFYYPDLLVSCEPFSQKQQVVEQPILIVEILSPSTRYIDRREKLIAYTKVPSLKEYLVVYQDRQRLELHRRSEQGWLVVMHGAGDTLKLDSLPGGGLTISVSEIYTGLDVPPVVKEEEEEYFTATY